MLLALGIYSHDSLLTYHTQCSSQQVPSSMPITYSPLSSTPPWTFSLFPVFKSFLLFNSLSVWNYFPLLFLHVLLLCFSKSTFEWKYICFSLTDFTSHTTLQFHPCRCKWHDFILSHCQVISIVYINHIFTHSSVDGHLGSFHNLVILDSINVGAHVPLWISTPVSLGYTPSSAIAGL